MVKSMTHVVSCAANYYAYYNNLDATLFVKYYILIDRLLLRFPVVVNVMLLISLCCFEQLNIQ